MSVLVRDSYLMAQLKSRSARVGIIGLGYVGLPTAMHKVEEGYSVTGFDVSEEKVHLLMQGESYIKDVPSDILASVVDKGDFLPTTDMSLLADMDVIVICVPTPINQYKEPDLSFVQSATDLIASFASRDTLVLLESTTYPGTTEEIIIPALESKGFIMGTDMFVAYSPERVDPGNQHYSLHNTPKVVGGLTAACLDLATTFVGETAFPVSSIKVAEMCKAYENSFRFINMGFANEMATICNAMNIDIWEVIEASSSKPYGFMKFTPGVGVGGHCIPVDPYYITYKAKEFGKHTKMIDLAGDINDGMKGHAQYRLMDELNNDGKSLKQSTVVVMGVSYKENISDVRESPVLPFLDGIVHKVKRVVVVDPYVSTFSYNNVVYQTEPYHRSLIEQADAVVMATPHMDFNYEEIASHSKLILDTKNAFGSRNIRRPYITSI